MVIVLNPSHLEHAMALRSNLMRGNPQLEACLISDPAHVTPGSVGVHVSKIQQALFSTNNASIDGNELATMTYGPSTVAAVLAFKGPPRNILGPGQLTPDNIVGKRTILALDSEMFAIEHANAVFDADFGTISWIEPRPSPITKAIQALDLNPGWIPKAALGLIMVSNTAPPFIVNDFTAFKAAKDFRGMMSCRVRITVDGVTDAISVTSISNFVEAGFTPPASVAKAKNNSVVFGFGEESQVDSKIPAVMRSFTQGELSSVSSVVFGARHPNSSITAAPANQQVVFNAIVKFRANPAEDAEGVKQPEPGILFHVPWVWCETLVTYGGQLKFNLFGAGSLYPSHAWYINGNQTRQVIQSCDTSFPVFPGTSLINESAMILTSFFKSGVPAALPQQPLAAEAGLSGSVSTHPNTAASGVTAVSTTFVL